jgi:predicted alpha/beta hydrolase
MTGETQAPEGKPITIAARDGYPLAATVFEPAGAAKGAVLIASATGVPASFYDKFASFLAGRGYRVVTFDYRGIGRSAPERLRGFKMRARDWGEQDLAAMLDWTAADAPGGKAFLIGHSIGGQLVALLDNHDRIAGLIGIGAQAGALRLWSGRVRIGFALLTYAYIPILTRLLGYFPSRVVGMGEPLPKGMALDWAGWCRSPNYVLDMKGGPGRAHVEALAAPVIAYGISDDYLATPRPVDVWLAWFANAPKERRHVTPEDLGETAVGHFRPFRLGAQSPLWQEVAGWLDARAEQMR